MKLRLKHDSTTEAQLRIASLSFWLAHMAVGVVSFQEVACHVFLLLRLSEDYKPSYALKYHDRPMTRLHNRISAGETFNIGAAITTIDMDILREVDHQTSVASAEVPEKASKVKGPREGGSRPRYGPSSTRFGKQGRSALEDADLLRSRPRFQEALQARLEVVHSGAPQHARA